MKGRTIVPLLLLSLAFILPLTLRADQNKNNGHDDRGLGDDAHNKHELNTPVHHLGIIPTPGNPITSADISRADPGTERYYFADRSNLGVDTIDAETNLFVGRVSGI